jgi:hypothetical protein
MLGPAQRREEGVRHLDDAEHVRLVHPAEAIDGLLVRGLVVQGDAGVVDQDVQGGDLARGGGDAAGVGHVEHQRPGAAAELPHRALAAPGVP